MKMQKKGNMKKILLITMLLINSVTLFANKEEKTYYENGNIEKIENFKDGSPTGKWITYYENGQLKEESNYEDGQKHGESKIYYENGNIKYKLNFENGWLEKKFTWYPNNEKTRNSSDVEENDRYKLPINFDPLKDRSEEEKKAFLNSKYEENFPKSKIRKELYYSDEIKPISKYLELSDYDEKDEEEDEEERERRIFFLDPYIELYESGKIRRIIFLMPYYMDIFLEGDFYNRNDRINYGSWYEFYENGKIKERSYIADEKQGITFILQTSYYENGNKLRYSLYFYDESSAMNSYYIRYNENEYGKSINYVLNIVFHNYYFRNKLIYTEGFERIDEFDEGELTVRTTYRSNGRKETEEIYKYDSEDKSKKYTLRREFKDETESRDESENILKEQIFDNYGKEYKITDFRDTFFLLF